MIPGVAQRLGRRIDSPSLVRRTAGASGRTYPPAYDVRLRVFRRDEWRLCRSCQTFADVSKSNPMAAATIILAAADPR